LTDNRISLANIPDEIISSTRLTIPRIFRAPLAEDHFFFLSTSPMKDFSQSSSANPKVFPARLAEDQISSANLADEKIDSVKWTKIQESFLPNWQKIESLMPTSLIK
jgi:hypothetical protein